MATPVTTPLAPRIHARSLGVARRNHPSPRQFVPPSSLARLRKLALALPEAHEVEAWGEPTFRVRNKLFAMHAAAGNHHGDGRDAVWCKAAPGNQGLMVAAAPDRFFIPPYVGPSGWIGIWLGGRTDWSELAMLLSDSYRLVAPKRLAAALSPDAVAVPPVARPRAAGKRTPRAKAAKAARRG